ncbi:MAG: 30S ribosomal protein S8 [Candidatus Omnitrophota bacterium]
MGRTDLVADVFTIIRNAARVRKEFAEVPASSMVQSIAQILKREGYIENYKFMEDKKQGILRIYLKYTGNKSAIKNLKRVSRPGLRIYAKKHEIPSVLRGRGVAFISTSQGILADKEAREKKVGGEVIGSVW